MWFAVSSTIIELTYHDAKMVNVVDERLHDAFHPSGMGYVTLSELVNLTRESPKVVERLLAEYIKAKTVKEYYQQMCARCSDLLSDEDDECANCGATSLDFIPNGETAYRVVGTPIEQSTTDQPVPLQPPPVGTINHIQTVDRMIQIGTYNERAAGVSGQAPKKRRSSKGTTHMDPAMVSLIASSTISLIRPYLEKATEGFAEHFGDLTADAASKKLQKGKEAFELLTHHFKDNSDISQKLAALAQQPNDDVAADAVQEHLESAIPLAPTLATKLNEYAGIEISGDQNSVIQNNIQGGVKKMVNITNNSGPLTF